MPSLTLPPSAGMPVQAARRRCRIFVSYAHQDRLRPPDRPDEDSLVERFEVELKNLRTILAGRGCILHEDEVFVDSYRLNTEPEWPEVIRRAVDECELLIFLVSPHSIKSDYCVNDELRPAAKRKVFIVPLLLRPTAGWKEIVLGIDTRAETTTDDQQRNSRQLGKQHSGGLPKNQLTNAMAVTHPAWKDRDLAWESATLALVDLIAARLFGNPVDDIASVAGTPASLAPSASPAQPTRTANVLISNGQLDLPVAYFCDQMHVTSGFTDGVDTHLQRHPPGRPHALLAIVQGEYDDQPERMINRLHHYHLAARLQAAGVAHARQLLPMQWPTGSLVDRLFAGRAVLKLLCEAINPALASALAGCQQAQQAADLIDNYFARPDVLPVAVFACLPARDKATTASLVHLVQCLDLCGNSVGQMAKLAVYCIDEVPSARAYWSKLIPQTQRVATLPLEPMKPVNDKELRQWHVHYGLEPRWPWPECLSMFHHTLAKLSLARQELRLRQWAEAVKHHRPDLAELIPELPKSAR